MLTSILTFSVLVTLIFPSAARLAGGNTDFDSQVKELIRTSPPTDCERGPGATMLCNENEFCKLDKSSTCPSTEYRRFTGTCVPAGMIPCPAIWDPVCGCDGVTYGSECTADAARVDIKHKGECQDEVKVTPCPLIYAPVCGCDGNTYDNECLAEAAGTVVCSQGQCSTTACPLIYAPVCGCDGVTYDSPCNAEAAGVAVCNDQAACKPCPKNFAPVCGCNGYTYDNSCVAENFGAEICSEGQCPMGASYCTYSPDTKCYPDGGWPACCSDNLGGASCPSKQPDCDVRRCERGVSASNFCDDDQFCKLDNSSSCPSTEHRTFAGTCVAAGPATPCPLNWSPVCGCDGNTYGNECVADASRVDIKHKGECKSEKDQLNLDVKRCERGINASKFCNDNQFCKLDNSSSCPSTEHRTFVGTCVAAGPATPCPFNWSPVCGCDGNTYGNECVADASRVDIRHKGECKSEKDQVKLY
ncbi:hypothetical protein ACHAW6_005961 [Cyclotella cf. meneghiniana]